jgi:hypothetical protein
MAENCTVCYDLMISLVRPVLGFTTLELRRLLKAGLFIVIANLVLEDTVERIHHGDAFAENWHGLFLIRGENVVLLGEIVRWNISFIMPLINDSNRI